MTAIGAPINRVDGSQKVIGAAKYSAEFAFPHLAYAAMVQSTIPSGRIAGLDASEAERAAGVVAVLTPRNAPKLPAPQSRLSLLQDDRVHYNGQPIALVIAESQHQALYAASLVRVRYQDSPAKLDFQAGFATAHPGSHNDIPGDMMWGDVNRGLAEAEVKIEQTYTTPIEHHNPMEPHATIARWENGKLTVYSASQSITANQQALAKIFALPPDHVEVICLYVGGGFGCKGPMWSHVVLAVMAAKQTGRPVKLVLERPQMFGPVGARPRTQQRITLGARRDGKLTAIQHQVYSHTSMIEDYLESSAFPTRVMYACANIETVHRIVPLNLGTPTYMRAPGVATGTYALEVAMDELAYELKMDPLQLRLLNYAEKDPHSGDAFTEKSLRECYTEASERFGWSKRTMAPGSMRDGPRLIGWGMATETYPANRMPAAALVRFQADGKVLVASGTQEIGNGIYTAMTQIVSDILDLAPERIEAKLGDTILPKAPISAGSMTTASIGPAVLAAAREARRKLLVLAAQDPQSPVYGAPENEIEFRNGAIFRKGSSARVEPFADLLARRGNRTVEGTADIHPPEEVNHFSSHSFGAIFAEIAVDPRQAMVKVRRIVAVYDVGRLINQKLARSQFIGGIVWGIGLALQEDTFVDPRDGRIVNANLAQYHVPVNADVPEIDASAVDHPDWNWDSQLGARGIGEIGITGTGAAIANAVYHATGKRIRDLPITPDKLID